MKSLFFLQQPVSHKAAEEFVKLDPYGIGMTLVAMTVVFLSLLILYITFKNIAKLFNQIIFFILLNYSKCRIIFLIGLIPPL